MVWLAASGSTAVLGYLLYRYLTLSPSPGVGQSVVQKEEKETILQDGAPTFSFDELLSDPDHTRPKPPTKSKNIGNGEAISTRAPDAEKSRETPSTPMLKVPIMSPPPVPSRNALGVKSPVLTRMPAPPRPGGSTLRPPPSAAASLRVPVTKVLSNTSMAPTSSTLPQNGKSSRQVVLQPGHSPLDWAMLTKNPNSRLRGKDVPDHLIRVTPSQLKYHTGRRGKDAWAVYQGKVYNISPYLPFHPGGEAELMRGAGRDAGQLFMEVHPWVNWDNMLGECMVGILVGEDDDKNDKPNNLDDTD